MSEHLASLIKAMEILPDGLLIVDGRQLIVGCNHVAEALFGYERGELAGQPLAVLLPPTARKAHANNVGDYDPARDARPMEARPVLSGISKTGERLPLSIGISTLDTPDGRFFVAVVRDARLLDGKLEEAKSLADTDPLTQLGNRRHLSSALAKSEQGDGDSPLAVLYLDLDRFKPLNDRYGHEVGDEVLKIVALRMRRSLRDCDTCTRAGGDEFVVIVDGVSDREALKRVASKLEKTITAPIHVQKLTLSVGVSIGGAIGSPARTGADVLLDHADAAMYRAKLDGVAYRCHELPRAAVA